MRICKFNTQAALLLLTIIFSIGSSCTVQKRLHRKGWYVEWNSFKRTSDVTTSEEDSFHDAPSDQKVPAEVTINETQSKEVPLNKSIHVDETSNEETQAKKTSKSPAAKGNSPASKTAVESFTHKNQSQPKRDSSQTQSSAPRVPLLAWALLYAGILLLAIGIIAALIYASINLSFIGLPLPFGLAIIAGVILLILATGVAVSNMTPQPSSPDPPYEKEAPKKEKKERKPLEKNDKIFLAVIGFVALGIVIALLSF